VGGGSGGGYSSSTAGVNDNASELTGAFPLTKSGSFGEAGRGKVRVIVSDNPSLDGKKFFDIAAKGGKVTQIVFEKGPKSGQFKGWKASFPNGDVVTYRPETKSSKNPGIQLTVGPGRIKSQKIHFEKKEK
jgi:hypothetical protein